MSRYIPVQEIDFPVIFPNFHPSPKTQKLFPDSIWLLLILHQIAVQSLTCISGVQMSLALLLQLLFFHSREIGVRKLFA